MRRQVARRVVASLFVLLAPVSLALAQGVTFQEVEPNNTRQEANVPPALASVGIRGTMDFRGDLDYFQTELVEGNLIRVFAGIFTGEFDGRVQILNANGDVLAEAARVSPATTLTVSALVTAATPPGVGYVRFSNDIIKNDINTFVYSSTVSRGLPEVEPNNSIGQAQQLDLEFPILASYPTVDDASNGLFVTDDFFKIATTVPGQTLVLAVSYLDSANVNLRMELLNADGEILASAERTTISGTGAPKNPSLVFHVEQPEQFYLRVYNPFPVASNTLPLLNYSVFSQIEDGTYEIEPNQSFREAIRLIVPPGENGTRVTGSLQNGLDVDLYRVSVPAGFALISDVNTTSSIRIMDGVTSMFIEEDLGASFASSDNSSLLPAGASFALINPDPYIRAVPPRGGDIIVGVADRRNFGSAEGFRYDLNLKIVPAAAPENEPNNQPGSERRLQSGEVVRGTIGASGDIDRFVLAGQAGETLLVNLNAFGIGSFLDARVILTDSLGTTLADQSVSPFSPDPFILIPLLPADDDYFIQVRARQGAAGSGASYYYELETSLTTSIQTIIADPDIDGTGRVDGFDLTVLARIFGATSGDPEFLLEADLIRDGVIDGQDLAALGNFFGTELNFSGSAGLLVDTVGDDLPFFGPATDTTDLLGIATAVNGSDLNFSVFFRDTVTANKAGVISIDSDASSLTGSQGTPDSYVSARNLGSELELFFDNQTLNLFSIPDPRGDIYPAFEARVGDIRAGSLPINVSQRKPLVPTQVGTGATTASGNQIAFKVPLANLGGSALANAAALGISAGDVEPTDRLPNQGKVSLQPPRFFDSITVVQLACDNDRRIQCSTDADCPGSQCVDLDSLPPDSVGGAPIVPNQRLVYLRTQDGGPIYRDWERSVRAVAQGGVVNADTGQLAGGFSNDTLDRVFPLGTRGLSTTDTRFEWFTRDLLSNFSYRDGTFDPHTSMTATPPDVDYYYLVGGEGDNCVLDLTTATQGATFDSKLELFRIPLSLAALDPTSPASQLAVANADLTLVASNDDKGGGNLDPRIETTLPVTSLYVVRVSASSKQTTFPGTDTLYSLYHESIRPDEFSIPIIARGRFIGFTAAASRLAGLGLHLDFDPSVVRMTGIDLAQGTRSKVVVNDRNPSMAQEYVAERLSTTPGRVRVAIRSYRDQSFQLVNGLEQDGLNLGSCSQCPEIVVARLRFRAVGPGTTRISIAPNPTQTGEPLLNLGLGEQNDGPIWQPFFGYGPGVQVTVTEAP